MFSSSIVFSTTSWSSPFLASRQCDACILKQLYLASKTQISVDLRQTVVGNPIIMAVLKIRAVLNIKRQWLFSNTVGDGRTPCGPQYLWLDKW